MKKVIFGILALIFAFALVIGGYFLITSRNLQKYVVEEGVPCPYSWQELRDGTYRLEIDTAAYPDGSWSVECYPKDVVAATGISSDSGVVTVSILPLNMGQTYLQVCCEQTEPVSARVFEVGMQISVSEDLEITVEKTEDKAYDGVITLGEDSDSPIQWWRDPYGAANLMILEESNGNWAVMDYDTNTIDVNGPFYRQNSCGFEITGKQMGNVSLKICDGIDQMICLEVEVAEDLTAAITSFAVEAYTVDRSEEHAALESAVGGTVNLPEQAVAMNYSTKSSGGSVTFMQHDRQWQWQIVSDRTVEEVMGDISEYASETETAAVNGVTLTAYGLADGVIAFWSEGEHAMALYGEQGVPLADALTVAGQVMEANHG